MRYLKWVRYWEIIDFKFVFVISDKIWFYFYRCFYRLNSIYTGEKLSLPILFLSLLLLSQVFSSNSLIPRLSSYLIIHNPQLWYINLKKSLWIVTEWIKSLVFILRFLKSWFSKKPLFFYHCKLVPDLLEHYLIVYGKSVYIHTVMLRINARDVY